MAVVVVVIGVGVCTVTDVQVNAKGFICACVAVFCTSLQQIVSIFHILSTVNRLETCFNFLCLLEAIEHVHFTNSLFLGPELVEINIFLKNSSVICHIVLKYVQVI